MGENPIHRKTKVCGKGSPALLVGTLRRDRKKTDGQQVDIPVLEYEVMQGRSRLTCVRMDIYTQAVRRGNKSQMLIPITRCDGERSLGSE